MGSANMLKEAKALHDLGWALHWCYPREKRPVGSKWTTGPRKSWAELKAAYKPGFNLGVRLGEASKVNGGYLACIDIDVKDKAHAGELLDAAKRLTGGALCPTVASGSGNGSRHLYCVTKTPFKMLTLTKGSAGEVCVYSTGRQMVLPPSIHPNGERYRWIAPLITRELPLLSFEGIERAEPKPDAPDSRGQTYAELGLFNVPKAVTQAIMTGEGVTDRSEYLFFASKALAKAGASRAEILDLLSDRRYFLGQAAYEHAQTTDRAKARAWLKRFTIDKAYGEGAPAAAFASEAVAPAVLDTLAAKEQEDELKAERSWRQDLRRKKGNDDDPGHLIDTLNNLDLILTNTIKQPLFLKNEFTLRESYGVDVPWGASKGGELADIDTILIKSWLAKGEFGIEPKKENIENAMALLAHRNRSHPVRDWLNSLKWDGKPRIDTWIKEYLQGRAPEPYLSAISRKFLVAMVARIFQPGCQWDYTLVLEGEQGTRKSTTARILASDKWFCDHLPDLKEKDAMLNLQGSWLVELAELRNIKHSDAGTVKAFLTRRVDRVRAPYGKRWMDAPRQSVFIGTVNENEYFKDPTGNRRFWPVHVGMCDTESLARDRDQLFAEAKIRYDAGEELLYLDGRAAAQACDQQAKRMIEDEASAMEEALLSALAVTTDEKFDFSRFKMEDLFAVNGAPLFNWGKSKYRKNNAGVALSKLGFKKFISGGYPYWKYEGERSRPACRPAVDPSIESFL